MPEMRSVQLYSVRDDLAADQRGTLGRLAEIGFTHVEAFGLGGWKRPYDERLAAVKTLRADLTAAGLVVSGAHAGIPDDFRELVAECDILEVTTVFVPHPNQVRGFDEDTFADPGRIDGFAETLGTLALEASRRGLRLGYHNHDFEWAVLPDGTPGFHRFWSRTAAELYAELDVYWATVAGADPAAELIALGERAIALHLKDGPAARGIPQTPLGTGDVDIAAAVAAGTRVEWHIGEIDTTDHDPYDLLKINADYLRSSNLFAHPGRAADGLDRQQTQRIR